MTEDFRNDLIRYRLERARDTYDEVILKVIGTPVPIDFITPVSMLYWLY